jgi:hypothetical protein
MKTFFKSKITLILLSVLASAACQDQSTVTVNNNQPRTSNVPAANNVNSNSANNNSLSEANVGIDAKEPEQYQAKVTLKLETGSPENTTALPPLVAQVARQGDNRRMEFTLPGGEKIIYLDRGGQQFVISTQRKQYAELSKEALGVDPRRMLMPEQIVKQVKNIKGIERVGDDKFGGRDVVKYRYSAATEVKPPVANSNSSTPANVSTDAVVLVDKETGLPLRSETFVESNNTSIKGIKNLRLVTEMTDFQMNTDPNLFAEPTDYKKVAPEEVRGQMELVFKALGALLQQVMNSQSTNNQPPPPASPLNSPTPVNP